MTDKYDDGGPAYPNTVDNRLVAHGRTGMSLHDAFLLAVVQGEIAASGSHKRPEPKDLAQYAFDVADAMIAERNKRRGEG